MRWLDGITDLMDMGSSRVGLQIERAPGIAVELKRTDALFPTVGVIQRLENQVKRLPDEVVKLEQRINEARDEYRDASTALREPFKHAEALEAVKWDVERITRTMNGEENPQPTIDPELLAHRRRMRAERPNPKNRATPSAQLPDASVWKKGFRRGKDPDTGREF